MWQMDSIDKFPPPLGSIGSIDWISLINLDMIEISTNGWRDSSTRLHCLLVSLSDQGGPLLVVSMWVDHVGDPLVKSSQILGVLQLLSISKFISLVYGESIMLVV